MVFKGEIARTSGLRLTFFALLEDLEHVVKGGRLDLQGAFEDTAGHHHNPFSLRFHPPIVPYRMTFA